MTNMVNGHCWQEPDAWYACRKCVLDTVEKDSVQHFPNSEQISATFSSWVYLQVDLPFSTASTCLGLPICDLSV